MLPELNRQTGEFIPALDHPLIALLSRLMIVLPLALRRGHFLLFEVTLEASPNSLLLVPTHAEGYIYSDSRRYSMILVKPIGPS